MEKKDRNPIHTLLIIILFLVIVYLLKSWEWSIILAIVLGLLGLFSRRIVESIDFLWFKIGSLIGIYMSKIILTCIFFLILTPIALLSRLLGSKDPLKLKNSQKSLFQKRHEKPDKGYFERLW